MTNPVNISYTKPVNLYEPSDTENDYNFTAT